jgi:hypothetical protein
MSGMDNSEKPLTGGCQCGAVRYEWVEAPQYASVCHCRMCQKASGQPFMALAGGRKERLRWTKGSPATFKSSNIAERGFCANCGTQLTYARIDSGRISVAMNSFDDPEAVKPTKQYGIESKVSWLDNLFDLPAQRTDEWMSAGDTAKFQNCQHADKPD